ncbi:MAG TPA: phytanoyl-CoA dioxygenase family protein [Caldilineaceae bacterium]|nr:phytanoyl-CoA dioxygenase family protein [Caldilineaceae bacterium]
MNYEQIQKPELSYRYEFGLHELDAAQSCIEAHGFAVIKQMLPADMVEELKASVLEVIDPKGELGPGQSYTHTSFIEYSPALWKLFAYEPFMKAQKVFCQADELTINRTAAILRNPGSAPLVWHSDWRGFSQDPPKAANDVLNRGPWPSGLWFYLTGSYPKHGGLAVIEDSHVPDWPGPEGFELTPDKSSFYPKGSEPKGYNGFEIPGLVPLFTDPGDEIVFAARTYHSAFPNRTDQVRLSCGIGLRPRAMRIEAPWPLSERAQAFIKAQPPQVQPMVKEYVGIDPSWRSTGMM